MLKDYAVVCAAASLLAGLEFESSPGLQWVYSKFNLIRQ